MVRVWLMRVNFRAVTEDVAVLVHLPAEGVVETDGSHTKRGEGVQFLWVANAVMVRVDPQA